MVSLNKHSAINQRKRAYCPYKPPGCRKSPARRVLMLMLSERREVASLLGALSCLGLQGPTSVGNWAPSTTEIQSVCCGQYVESPEYQLAVEDMYKSLISWVCPPEAEPSATMPAV